MEEGKKRSNLPMILGLCVLIAALMFGAACILLALEDMGAKMWADAPQSTVLTAADGSQSEYQLSVLQEQGEEVEHWLDQAGAWQDQSAYWLYRREMEDYLLYLPMQDIALSAADCTATEETGTDGRTDLVLRLRTPEEGAPVEPRDQILVLTTTSKNWTGVDVKVVLDGRALNVYRAVAQGGAVYSAERGGLDRG